MAMLTCSHGWGVMNECPSTSDLMIVPMNDYFHEVYTRCLSYSWSLYKLIVFANDDRWLWTHHRLTDWQMEYGLVCCKGRPDRISHLQRPRICLRGRETDTESMSSDIPSVSNHYQTVSYRKDNNVIDTKRIYHTRDYKRLISWVNVHQKSPSYILPLACSRRPDGTKAKQAKKEAVKKQREAVREQPHQEKKHWHKT